MRASRIIALVLGCLVAIPALAFLFSGVLLALASATQVGDDGFFDADLARTETPTVALTAEEIDLEVDPGTPRWVLDAIDTDVRLQVTGADPSRDVFVGVAPEADLDAYLAGVAHDEIRTIDGDEVRFRSREGSDAVAPPGDQTFWAVQASGPGTQELVWEPTSGSWAVAVMNADGSPGVVADVTVGARSEAVVPVTVTLLAIGVALALLAALLIAVGAAGLHRHGDPAPGVGAVAAEPGAAHPLTVEAQLDPQLSRWRWLVKWFLAIPHLLILALLWVGFFVLTVVAGIAILVTGRYPRSIFDVNVGILRWSWRVSYYCLTGGLGTDRYPPFTLSPDAAYPASLDLAYPERLNRWLVLVKWWLLALPHYLVLALLGGASVVDGGGFSLERSAVSIGLIGVLVLIAAVGLLFTGRYPRPLFDLVIGLNRWVYRVIVYAALLTDRYPPFRLDQGGAEPVPAPSGPPDGRPDAVVDLSTGTGITPGHPTDETPTADTPDAEVEPVS